MKRKVLDLKLKANELRLIADAYIKRAEALEAKAKEEEDDDRPA